MPESNREEIAKLEALYASNPDGRVFTHLAEAYRKAGEYDRARTILEQGLAKHPAYASAHVVLGRVFMDLNSPEEAFESFRRVLNLDPHNLVALRSLGDLARNAGRNVEAIGYYEELRHQDPSNDELEGIIAELLAPPAPAAQAAAPEAAYSEPPDFENDAPSAPVIESEQAAEETAASSAPSLPDFAAAPDFGETGPDDLDLGWADDDSEEPLPGDLAGFAGLSAAAQNGQEGFGDIDLGGDTGTEETSDEVMDVSFGDVQEEEMSEAETLDLGVFAEPPQPEASFEPEPAPLFESEPEPPAVFAPEPEVEPLPAFEAAAEPDFMALPEPQPEAGTWAAEPTAPSGEVVTETMAELYRNQGLYDRAAEVYRHLLERRPDDSVLRTKLAEVEALARGGGMPAAEIPTASEEFAIEDEPSFVPGAPESISEALPPSADEPESAGWEPQPETEFAPEWEPETQLETPRAWQPEPESMFDAAPEPEPESEAEPEPMFDAAPESEPEPEPEPEPAFEAAEPEPDFDAADEVDSIWTGGGVAQDVPTPYAWSEESAGGASDEGPPVAGYFQSLLEWRPAKSATEPAEEVAAPEPEILELDAPLDTAEEPLFQEEEEPVTAASAPEPQEQAAPVAPSPAMPWDEPAATAAPVAASASPPKTSPSDTPVEDAFDEWFGEPEPAAETAPAPEKAAGGDDPATEGDEDDDLEMFRSWLQSLKK